MPRLRSSFPAHFLASGGACALHPRRDTWYSAPMCQINWWFPVYPLEPGNAMAIYPHYFDTPVANNSETYNHYERKGKSRVAAARHVDSDAHQQPQPLRELAGPRVTYLPPPAGVIMFSGAQLHETVPNATDMARYSIDFRTVHIDDVAGRRGAANIDTRCTGTTMRDYRRGSDLSRIPEALIKSYDDGTEAADTILYIGDRPAQGVQAAE